MISLWSFTQRKKVFPDSNAILESPMLLLKHVYVLENLVESIPIKEYTYIGLVVSFGGKLWIT